MSEPPEVPEALRGRVRDLHHVAIVVASLDEARARWVDALGLAVEGEPERVEDQKVDVLVCRAGSQRIELVAPAADDSPVSRFLERGGGLHHLAFRVDDLARTLGELEEAGLRLIDRQPRPGAHGTRIAFVHPRSLGGVLVELVEVPGGRD